MVRHETRPHARQRTVRTLTGPASTRHMGLAAFESKARAAAATTTAAAEVADECSGGEARAPARFVAP